MIPLTFSLLAALLALAACGGGEPTARPQAFQATVAPVVDSAPVYTPTPTLTPSLTPTVTPSSTPTPTLTLTPSPTPTDTPTLTPTLTPSPTPTAPLITLTAPRPDGAPDLPGSLPVAGFSPAEGWTCDDFPCEDDLDGFLQRIQVPPGFALSHVGRFPGQVNQIAYGRDGALYATVLEGGTLRGGVYVLPAEGGDPVRYHSQVIESPVGLAFQPGTDVLYVTGRLTDTGETGEFGAIWRILPDGTAELAISGLPCCFDIVGQQPNGLAFGQDGYLYVGVGALTDRLEPPNPQRQRFADRHPLEAAILRIQPHTGDTTVYARGIRDPFDLTFDSAGQFYATDTGLLDGMGDRVLRIAPGAHYGWPYWRNRGCFECPFTDFSQDIQPDLVPLRDYTRPRGIVAYTGTQFPRAYFDTLFVALWNGTDDAQRIVHIDPRTVPTDPERLAEYTPPPFVTGLIRPTDVVVSPDGALVIADYVYGHVWRVDYVGDAGAVSVGSPTAPPAPVNNAFATSTPVSP